METFEDWKNSEDFDEDIEVRVYYFVEEQGFSIQDALTEVYNIGLYPGSNDEYINENLLNSRVYDWIRPYFDYKGYAIDYLGEFEYKGQIYTVVLED